MKNKFLSTIFCFVSTFLSAQDIKLTDHIIYPRLDSTFWEKDYETLNKVYSRVANRCQTCVYKQTDTTRGRFCFNTSLGHVQMDTSLNNFAVDKLIGQWELIDNGIFEIADSVLAGSKLYYRNTTTLSKQKEAKGFVTFTAKRLKINFKNFNGIPNRNKRYKILDGRFLTTKMLTSYCGATIIGLTKDGYLILDDHTYRTLAKREKYLVVRTSIRRLILKKSTTA